jgi:uncharacterized lipoprotein YmbA
MRIWSILFLAAWLAACSQREVRCNGKLSAINQLPDSAAARHEAAGGMP